jgi:tRNA-2-methylthio-N6-dimethylallyladenosine synthase
MRLVADIGFASAFSFKYSPRPGTPAAEMETQVPEPVKAERLARLQNLLETQRQAFNRGTVGQTLDVLLEKPGRHPGQIAGKSPYLQAVQFDSDTHRVGEIVAVRIVRAGSNSLFGEWVKPGDRAAA